MAPQWQREFFLITEDPIAFDLRVFDLWIEGHSVDQAAEMRWRCFDTEVKINMTGRSSEPVADGDQHCAKDDESRSPATLLQFQELLHQDSMQQYEAFEFLESALADPVHFLQFCPVQLSLSVRRTFLTRFYSLDGRVVREVLRHANLFSIRPSGSDSKKAMAAFEQIARACNSNAFTVSRHVLNLQRVCRWIERIAEQRRPVVYGSSRGPFSSGASVETSEAFTAGDSLTLTIPVAPELEALGEPLSSRYRALAFVLLCKFDLSSKTSALLSAEHIEDIATVLLECGGVPSAPESRLHVVEVLLAWGEPTSLPAAVPLGALASAMRAGSVLDEAVQHRLRDLERNVLRPRLREFKEQLELVIERTQEHGRAPSFHDDAAGVRSPAADSRGGHPFRRGLFTLARGGKGQIEPMITALIAGVASLHNPQRFLLDFFGTFSDFMERLKKMSSSEPLELFQRCYTALELLGDQEQVPHKKTLWPGWLAAWLTFLEFYRACAACVLTAPSTTSIDSPKTPQQGSGILGTEVSSSGLSDVVADTGDGLSGDTTPQQPARSLPPRFKL